MGDEIFDLNYVQDIVNWADIIYEGGGNTLDMIHLWKTIKFDLILQKAWEEGKLMCGFSAGANCWFKDCSSDSLQLKYGPHQPLISVECLGFIDGLFVPHCNEPGRYKSGREILLKKNSFSISISNGAALEIIDDKYRLIIGNKTDFGFNHMV